MQLFRSALAQATERKNKFMKDHRGFTSLAPIMGVIGAVLIVIIVVLVLAALAPTFFQAAADITGALLDADLNSTLANTIAGIVAILVPLALLFGFVGLIFVAVRKFKSN